MTAGVQGKRIIDAQFTNIAPVQTKWNLYSRTVNTWKFLHHRGFYLEIFKNLPQRPYSEFPNWISSVSSIVIIQDPTIARKALEYYRNDKTEGGIFNTEKSSFSRLIQAVFPEITQEQVILTASKEKAKELHSFLVKQFSLRSIENQKNLIAQELETTLTRWEKLGTFDLNKETKLFTSSVIGKLFLGYHGDYQKLTKSVDVVFENLGMQSRIKEWVKRVQFWKWGVDQKALAQEKRLKEATDTIREAIQQIVNHESGPNEDPTICEVMRNEKKSDGSARFSEEDCWAMALVLILAGQDTTATAINFTLIQLARNLLIQEQFFKDELSIKNIIREGLRLCSPASLIGRLTNTDQRLTVTFEDESTESLDIPAQTLFTIAPSLMGRNPNVVEGNDLQTFNPSRWDDGREPIHLRASPLKWFGGGVQGCPGVNLAEMEMTLMITTLLERYVLSTKMEEPRQQTSFVNRLYGPQIITIERFA